MSQKPKTSRPLWLLPPNRVPVRANDRKVPKDVTAWCHEGDKEWTPVDLAKTTDDGPESSALTPTP